MCWWHSIVVRLPVLAGKLSLSCARLTAGRVTTLWVKCLLSVNQHGQLIQLGCHMQPVCLQAVGGSLSSLAPLISNEKHIRGALA